jgi:hypothetical protein
MAAEVLGRTKVKRSVMGLYEYLAMTGLAAIGAHGVALLGDHWLKSGWRGS